MPRCAQFRRRIHPGVKVLAAVAGRGVHEAGAGVVGDMIASEHAARELVTAADPLERVAADNARKLVPRKVCP